MLHHEVAEMSDTEMAAALGAVREQLVVLQAELRALRETVEDSELRRSKSHERLVFAVYGGNGTTGVVTQVDRNTQMLARLEKVGWLALSVAGGALAKSFLG